MKSVLVISAILFGSLFGRAQIILTNGDFDAYSGPYVNCHCSDFWTCGDDAGRVEFTQHATYSTGDQGCNTGANFMPQYGNFSPPASMYFYGGDDFAFHQTAINFPIDGEICIGVWYCGPQTPGTPDQNTAACYFTFAIDGVSVGPHIPVPDGTNWTLLILPFPITAGPHTFGVMSGDPGAYAIWFDNFNLDTTFCSLPPCDPGWNADTVFCASENSVDLSTLITGDLNGVWSGIGVTNDTFDIAYGTQDITYTLPFPCDTFLTQTIVVDAFTADITANNVTCGGAADGWAVVNTAGDPGPFAFNWNTSSNSDSIFNLSGGTYTVTVTNLASSCAADYSVMIVEPVPLSLSFDVVDACLPDLGSLTANVTGGSGSYNYAWQHTSDSSYVLYDLDSAYYYLTVTDSLLCSISDSAFVTVKPGVQLLMDSLVVIEYGECIVLESTLDSAQSWWPATGVDCADCASVFVCPTQTTTYCAAASNSYGCADTSCITVEVFLDCGEVFVPNAFSPDGNSENDLHCVYSKCFESFSFSIYDRWGQLVFESTDETKCWDGTFEGKPLSTAVFVYVLNGTLINGEVVNQFGNISLFR